MPRPPELVEEAVVVFAVLAGPVEAAAVTAETAAVIIMAVVEEIISETAESGKAQAEAGFSAMAETVTPIVPAAVVGFLTGFQLQTGRLEQAAPVAATSSTLRRTNHALQDF